jgi:DNA-binding response OmpR family regulator
MAPTDSAINKKYKILVVEDETQLRELYKTVIGRIENTEVFEANNAVDAIKIIKDEKPYLLIQDIELREKKNGWDIIREVRTFNDQIKIFVLSAYIYYGVEDDALLNELGIAKALKKPILPAEFRDNVYKILHDEEFIKSVSKIDERIIKSKLEIKQIRHALANDLTVIISECEVSAIKFATDPYVVKEPQKTAKAAIAVLDHVAEQLHDVVDKMDEIQVT